MTIEQTASPPPDRRAPRTLRKYPSCRRIKQKSSPLSHETNPISQCKPSFKKKKTRSKAHFCSLSRIMSSAFRSGSGVVLAIPKPISAKKKKSKIFSQQKGSGKFIIPSSNTARSAGERASEQIEPGTGRRFVLGALAASLLPPT